MSYDRQLFSQPKQVERRKELRHNLTSAEAALWTLLKSKQLMGRKFRKQHGIDCYIVDFCCPAEHLIIELDGEVHNDPLRAEYDMRREMQFRALGFKVLRFENKDVFQNTEAVLRIIASAFTQSL